VNVTLTAPADTLQSKARAFDHLRSIFWEFCDVDEGKAALACIGEFIGEWEHGRRGSPPDAVDFRAALADLLALIHDAASLVACPADGNDGVQVAARESSTITRTACG